MMNTPVTDHPMIGATLTLRPDMPDATHLPVDPGTVARHGDSLEVREVYHDWNGVEGLTMFYVYVPATGYHTHVSEREAGLIPYV